jgi:hypothetical protein
MNAVQPDNAGIICTFLLSQRLNILGITLSCSLNLSTYRVLIVLARVYGHGQPRSSADRITARCPPHAASQRDINGRRICVFCMYDGVRHMRPMVAPSPMPESPGGSGKRVHTIACSTGSRVPAPTSKSPSACRLRRPSTSLQTSRSRAVAQTQTPPSVSSKRPRGSCVRSRGSRASAPTASWN